MQAMCGHRNSSNIQSRLQKDGQPSQNRSCYKNEIKYTSEWNKKNLPEVLRGRHWMEMNVWQETGAHRLTGIGERRFGRSVRTAVRHRRVDIARGGSLQSRGSRRRKRQVWLLLLLLLLLRVVVLLGLNGRQVRGGRLRRRRRSMDLRRDGSRLHHHHISGVVCSARRGSWKRKYSNRI